MSCGTCDAGEDCPIHGGDIELRSGSLFTGTAALDMAAAEVFGVRPAWFCEYEPRTKTTPNPSQAAAKLLAYRFPQVPNLGDITKVDWELVAKLARVYVLTLGWPCQPWSLAGKRKGADDERALWPECERAIRSLRPRYLLLENVPNVVALGELERVATSLATYGYRFAWVCLPASAVGAPHKRERFFAVAEDTNSTVGGERRVAAPGQTESGWSRANFGGRGRAPAADTDRGGVWEQPIAVAGRRGAAVAEQPGAGVASYADRDQCEWKPVQQPGGTALAGCGGRPDWAGYAPAIERWESITGQPAPAPTVPGARGNRVLNPALPEWMMGLPAGWITDVPGLSRSDQLKLAGNGVVRQQAVAAYRYLLDVLAQDARAAA